MCGPITKIWSILEQLTNSINDKQDGVRNYRTTISKLLTKPAPHKSNQTPYPEDETMIMDHMTTKDKVLLPDEVFVRCTTEE